MPGSPFLSSTLTALSGNQLRLQYMLALGVDAGVDHLLEKAYPQHAHLLQRQLKGSNRSIPEL